MPDLLIRNVDDDTVRRIDADAQRQGLSRNEYLRREVSRLGRGAGRPATRDDLVRSMEAFADLGNDSVMDRAWS
jgi:hypothetical protein